MKRGVHRETRGYSVCLFQMSSPGTSVISTRHWKSWRISCHYGTQQILCWCTEPTLHWLLVHDYVTAATRYSVTEPSFTAIIHFLRSEILLSSRYLNTSDLQMSSQLLSNRAPQTPDVQ